MSTNEAASLPNPFTPMAFLPPALAVQVANGTYVLVGGCAVLVWDIVDNLANDYRLLTKYKVGIPTIAYFISRLGSLGLVLTGTLFISSGITWDCYRFLKVVGAFYPFSIAASSLLFFFRLRAVFDRNRIIVGFFLVIWLALFASSITIPFGMIGKNIGPTQYCVTVRVREFIVAPTIISFVHDTLVLFAISWRIMRSTHMDMEIRRGVKSMVLGDYLPAFSRGLLHDGQQYYSVTVTLNLLTTIMFFVQSVPPVYRIMFSVPNVALMNIMACRVFRNTKFGLIRDSSMSTSVLYTSQSAARVAHRSLPVRFNHEQDSTFGTSTDRHLEPQSEQSFVIHISKDVQHSQEEFKVYTAS